MNYRTRQHTYLRFLSSITILASILLSMMPSAAYAWKPSTHVYLAEEALKDALDDGKVTIHRVNYATGEILEKVGDYAVDPNVLAALRAHPEQFRAGVLGPDAYPDIVTGQRVIHPEVSHPDGSNSWLEHLWNATANESDATKAFVMGYLTHASGDMYGHTFVNNYTGGPFELGDNAIKHIVVEGYVGKRTPQTVSATGEAVTEASVSIDGVEDFIYQYMVNASPGSTLNQQLLIGEDGQLTLPYIYSTLRAELKQEIDAYYRTKGAYDREYDGHISDARNCGTFDFGCSATASYAQAAATQAQKLAYMASSGPGITYFEHWVDDIDDGLQAWPGVSHELAKQLVFNTNGVDNESITKVQEIIEDYRNDHLLSMSGTPDAVGSSLSLITSVMREIDFLRDAVKAIERDLLDYLLQTAVGLSIDDVKKYFTSPDKYFDEVMSVGAGETTTLAQFNQNVLKIADTDYNNPDERFDYKKLPAAYNTVTINKLILLSPSEMNRLLSDLGSTESLQTDNVMLGFIRILDGDNEWHNHDEKMVFAQNCDLYSQLFMHQIGEENGCETVSCFDAVQDKIAWNYSGSTRWNATNIQTLCRGAESSLEPAQCFQRVMHNGIDQGGIDQGNSNTRWRWQDAQALCKSTLDADETVQCFQSQISGGATLQQAIGECGK